MEPGIRKGPKIRVSVKHARMRNVEELDAKKNLYFYVFVAAVPPVGFRGLGTKVGGRDDGEEQASQVGRGRNTMNGHKPLHGCTFKKKACIKAIKEIMKFAQKKMGPSDGRMDVKLNKHLWSLELGTVPRSELGSGMQGLAMWRN
ncbi:hypothetical protein L7F22_031213 [Adiantum nelumboides]|nr:hypothetical protein [Adiantum nelumboides]